MCVYKCTRQEEYYMDFVNRVDPFKSLKSAVLCCIRNESYQTLMYIFYGFYKAVVLIYLLGFKFICDLNSNRKS